MNRLVAEREELMFTLEMENQFLQVQRLLKRIRLRIYRMHPEIDEHDREGPFPDGKLVIHKLINAILYNAV